MAASTRFLVDTESHQLGYSMRPKRISQSGFGIIPVIVIIAVVVILGFVGWRVFMVQSGNNNTGNNQTNGTQPSTDTYLDIKELGVKIKLGDGIKDAVYNYVAPTGETDAGFAGRADFSAQTIIDNGPFCSPQDGPLGSIVKLTGTVDSFGNALVADRITTFKLGNNYFRYQGPQFLCYGDNSDNSPILRQLTALREAFKTIQLDK